MMFWLVGLRGLEPRTSSLSGKRSNRLSYSPSESRAAAGLGPTGPEHAARKGYRIGDRDAYSVSLSVISIPPPRWVTRL